MLGFCTKPTGDDVVGGAMGLLVVGVVLAREHAGAMVKRKVYELRDAGPVSTRAMWSGAI